MSDRDRFRLLDAIGVLSIMQFKHPASKAKAEEAMRLMHVILDMEKSLEEQEADSIPF